MTMTQLPHTDSNAGRPDPAKPAGARARWASPFTAACLGALLLVVGAYANSLHNSFHFDDSYSIERNIFIRDLHNAPRFFTDARTFSSAPTNADYRPIVTLTLALDYWLGGGLAPTQFHITQILLLLALGALLFAFYQKLFDSTGAAPWHRWVALFTATLFCVHTGNTQTGNYISARSELLSGIGVLGAFVLYLYAPRSRRRHWYLLPMVFGALAKSPAVIFAPLLLVYKLLIEEQLSVREVFTRRAWPQVRSALRSSLPALALAGALFLFVADGPNGRHRSHAVHDVAGPAPGTRPDRRCRDARRPLENVDESRPAADGLRARLVLARAPPRVLDLPARRGNERSPRVLRLHGARGCSGVVDLRPCPGLGGRADHS
jgi:hypothetical protein